MSAGRGAWRLVSLLVAAASILGPTRSQAGETVDVSVGYAFSAYLEEDGGSAPLGAYLSVAGARGPVGLELDLAYHRDTFEDIALNTFTAQAGPRFRLGEGRARPFLHVLGGLRYDTVEGESNTSFGGMAGGGVDIKTGDRVSVRLGADFQIFFDEGENLKTLRLNVGFTF